MKNVMIKAWEIAKKGQQKFGGKAKEYFAQALKMAWAIVKSGVDKLQFQLVELRGKKFFAVLDQDDLKVTHHKSFLSIGRNFTKCEEVKPIHIAKNKKMGGVFRLYQYIPGNGKFVIETSGQSHTFENIK